VNNETVTTRFDPPYPGDERTVYVDGTWDAKKDTNTGGHWERPTHGGVCQRGETGFGGEPQPAVVGPHLHWNGGYYKECSLAERCPQPSCHAATPEDIRESRRRQSAEEASREDYGDLTLIPAPRLQEVDAEIAAWREDYGVFTLVPPPDWQPTSPFYMPRLRASLVLGRLAHAVYRLAFRIEPPLPNGDDIRAGRYPGAVDLLSQEELS